MFRFVTLLALLGLALGFDLRHQLGGHWERFKADHNKVYADEKEEAHRFNVFAQNFKFIQEHNAKHENGEASFWLTVNKFADLEFEEFKGLYLNYKGAEKKPAPFVHNNFDVSDLPASVDWRTKGIVTGVKDQAQCGSCWAFSAVASLEGAHAQSTGELVSLSEQNLMDCSTKYDNQGCEGGLMDQAFQYIIDNKGLDTEASYPYEGKDDSCRFNAANVGASAKSFVDVPTKNETALLTASSERVVSVAIDASLFLQLYGGGIFNNGFLCSDDAGSLNHGVTVVGYGSQSSKDFWIVKNSWGASWGEKGYVRFARGKNLCGIATQASYPLV